MDTPVEETIKIPNLQMIGIEEQEIQAKSRENICKNITEQKKISLL